MKPYNPLVLFTLIMFCQPWSGLSKNINELNEVKTHFGKFPLPIPDLRLPKLPKFPLVSVSEASLPELPDWKYPRFIPDDPSWLDRSGNYYKEGIDNFYRGDLNLSLSRFQTVTDEYPDTTWVTPSWFWQGQIKARQKEYTQSEKTLIFFLDLLEKNNSSDLFVDFQNFSYYSLAWLALKQKKYIKALEVIKKYEDKINIKKLRLKLLYLKYFAYVKLRKSDQIFFVLESMNQQFKYDFENLVYLAEYYFTEKRWLELADLVKDKANRPEFYNIPQREHLLWLGVESEMRLNRWFEAKKMLKSLEEFGVSNPDKLSQAWLRLFLRTGQYEKAWNSWGEINDDLLREQSLRELMHYAIKNEEFNFLLNKQPELKSFKKSWIAWQGELELFYAYIYLRLGLRKKSKQWLEWSFKNILHNSEGRKSSVVHEECIYFKTVIELLSMEHKKAFQSIKLLLGDYSDSERLSDYYFWYGVMLYELDKNSRAAMMAMRQVDVQSKRDDDRLYLVGKINHDNKRWSPSILAFIKLKKRHPTSEFLEEGLFLQARAYFELKKYNSGIEKLDQLLNTFMPLRKPIREIHLRVRILVAMQRYEQADKVLKDKISKYSDFSLIKQRVEVLKKINDPTRILNVTGFGLGMSTSSDHGFLFYHRANALYDTKKYDEAITYYNLALKNPPIGKGRVIRYRILKIQYDLGRIPEMLKGTKKFIDQIKDDTYSFKILHLISNYFMELNQMEKAAPYLEQLVSNYKNSVRKEELAPEKRVEYIVIIGELYNDLKKYDIAERWLNQALKSMETVKEGRKKWQLYILGEKGISLFMQNKHPQALAANLKVLYLDRNLSEQKGYDLNIRVASSYVKLGRETEARVIYNKMLKKFKNEKQKNVVEKLLSALNN